MTGEEAGWPDLGEFLVCTITTVKQNGVYVELDGYPGREGFIFIGEIASGWVKNIKSHVREGQRVVAKALKVRKDKKSVELSIKSVSDERRRDTLQRWKNKQRAGQLLRIVGERSGWDDAKVTLMNSELIETFGGFADAATIVAEVVPLPTRDLKATGHPFSSKSQLRTSFLNSSTFVRLPTFRFTVVKGLKPFERH